MVNTQIFSCLVHALDGDVVNAQIVSCLVRALDGDVVNAQFFSSLSTQPCFLTETTVTEPAIENKSLFILFLPVSVSHYASPSCCNS